MSTAELRHYIAQNSNRFIEELSEFCGVASISTRDERIAEGADFVVAMLEKRGVDTRILQTAGHPAVFGEIAGSSGRALLLYAHYDVQPAEPREAWRFDPFSATLEDGKLYARGVFDHKSSVTARIHALECLQAVGVELPVTLKFLIEGEEEIGSPSLGKLLEDNRDLLESEAAVYSGSAKNEEGRPLVRAGSKGMCYVELSVRGAAMDLHSSRAPLVVNPAWRLVWALATLKDQSSGECLIEGFYDDIEPPTQEDIDAIRAISFDGDKLRQDFGIGSFLNGVDGWQAIQHELFSPTCTICGLTSGYQGPGSMTVLPSKASAKVDFRLVPGQVPQDILAKLKRHLVKHGFGEIEVTAYSMTEPEKVPLDSPLVKAIMAAAEAAYDKPPILQPIGSGSGPRYLFKRWLGVPMVADCGAGYHLSGPHSANEHIRVDDYLQNVEHLAHLYTMF